MGLWDKCCCKRGCEVLSFFESLEDLPLQMQVTLRDNTPSFCCPPAFGPYCATSDPPTWQFEEFVFDETTFDVTADVMTTGTGPGGYMNTGSAIGCTIDEDWGNNSGACRIAWRYKNTGVLGSGPDSPHCTDCVNYWTQDGGVYCEEATFSITETLNHYLTVTVTLSLIGEHIFLNAEVVSQAWKNDFWSGFYMTPPGDRAYAQRIDLGTEPLTQSGIAGGWTVDLGCVQTTHYGGIFQGSVAAGDQNGLPSLSFPHYAGTLDIVPVYL